MFIFSQISKRLYAYKCAAYFLNFDNKNELKKNVFWKL